MRLSRTALILVALWATTTAYSVPQEDAASTGGPVLLESLSHEEEQSVQETTLAAVTEPRSKLDQARDEAVSILLEKMLQALGPAFQMSLPKPAPSLGTIPMEDNKILIEDGQRCADIYKRCSSQSFFASCEIPSHVDEVLWHQRFNLYFDVPLPNLELGRLINATMHIYKNISLPLEQPEALNVEVFAYKRRDKKQIVASTLVSSDFVGWVPLDVQEYFSSLRQQKQNHGFYVSVKDLKSVVWNVPDLFVSMDCNKQQENLTALPIEVSGLNGLKYPLLSMHFGYYSSVHLKRMRNRNRHQNQQDWPAQDSIFPYKVRRMYKDDPVPYPYPKKYPSQPLINKAPFNWNKEFNYVVDRSYHGVHPHKGRNRFSLQGSVEDAAQKDAGQIVAIGQVESGPEVRNPAEFFLSTPVVTEPLRSPSGFKEPFGSVEWEPHPTAEWDPNRKAEWDPSRKAEWESARAAEQSKRQRNERKIHRHRQKNKKHKSRKAKDL